MSRERPWTYHSTRVALARPPGEMRVRAASDTGRAVLAMVLEVLDPRDDDQRIALEPTDPRSVYWFGSASAGT